MHCHYYYCVLLQVVKLLPKSDDYCYLYVDLHLPTYQTFYVSEK